MTNNANRFSAVIEHLGLRRVFIATQLPGDIADFCKVHTDCVAGLALVIASRIEPDAFKVLRERLLVLTGDSGIPSSAADTALPAMPHAQFAEILGYAATAWSDITTERPNDLCSHLETFFRDLDADHPRQGIEREGMVNGVTYRIQGSGPALILPPFFLAASQWEPVLDRLARSFTTVALGGACIGGVALLEDRAEHESYRDLFRSILHRMAIPEGAKVLEVGCGPGSLCRQLLSTRPDLAVTGLDTNGYLLREGADLARTAGHKLVEDEKPCTGGLRLMGGDATCLPFDDASFDAVYSITVLEECDANTALSEIVRVLRLGGPAGVTVRAIDMPQWWNLDLPAAIADKVNTQPQSASPDAVADRSLYARMARAGLRDIRGFPQLLTFDRPDSPIWNYRATYSRSLLDTAERAVWDHAIDQARASKLLFQANPVHCAVGWK